MEAHWSTSRKLTYIALTTVMMFAVMGVWGCFVRPYTEAGSGWLISAVGLDVAFWLLIVAILVGFFALWAIGHFETPVDVPHKPWWFKVLATVFLGLPVLGLIVIVGVALAS